MKTTTTISILLGGLVLLLSSCGTKNILLSEEYGDVSDLRSRETIQHEITKDDKVSLSIWNHDDMSLGSVFGIYNSNEVYGKWVLVEEDGCANLPGIGRFMLEGCTMSEAEQALTGVYAQYLIEPIVVVKVLNREVTVLGEVRTPGKYILEKERNSISDMIGVAQGFTDYADFEEIKLVRGGVNYMIDMSVADPLRDYDIQVMSGDIIAVPSRRGKRLDQKAPTIIPFASAITAIGIIASLIIK